MKFLLRLILLLLLVGGTWLGWEIIRANRGRSAAAQAMRHEAWPQARVELFRYLRLHPADDQSRLMLAEAFACDDSLAGDESAHLAIDQLQRIPDTSPLAAKARTQEGRLRFLVLYEPIEGERMLRRALELAPDSFDANYMLWKLLDLTGRMHLTEPFVWKALETSPIGERPQRMCEWFQTEFSPASGAAPLDEKMGFIGPKDESYLITELRRLQKFRVAEPDSPVAAAALSRLFLRHGIRARAQEFLESAHLVAGAFDDPYYVASWIALRMDLGEFEQAEELFARWPGERSGYEYWKWEGIICDEVRHDDKGAVAALEKAGAVWPGILDWQLMFRKAHCLVRMKSDSQADQARAQAASIERMMEPDIQRSTRRALKHIEDPEQVALVVDFYRKLGRPREVEFWENHRIEQARARAPVATLGLSER
jgi:tetratricopeptide (TPR) repeat protein